MSIRPLETAGPAGHVAADFLERVLARRLHGTVDSLPAEFHGLLGRAFVASGGVPRTFLQRWRAGQEPRTGEAYARAYWAAVLETSDIGYQTLINLYLRECAGSKKRLSLIWGRAPGAAPRR